MRITRRDVLLAIASETLWPKKWVEQVWNPGCRVCVVGAVLRGQGLSNVSIQDQAPRVTKARYSYHDDLVKALRDGNYLGALSIQFELLAAIGLNEDRVGVDGPPIFMEKYVKPKLQDWVLENFPDDVLYED